MVSLEGKHAATLVDSAGTDAHWLADAAVGRVFVGWSDASRVVLPAAIVLLWVALAVGWWIGRAKSSVADRWLALLFFVALLMVPSVLFFSASPTAHPDVSPPDGGATDASLLGYMLWVVLILLLVPHALGIPKGDALDRNHVVVFTYLLLPPLLRRAGAGHASRTVALMAWSWFAVSAVVFGLASKAGGSLPRIVQILVLATLLPWPLLLTLHWKRFDWESGSSQ
jgi:hypothetical protein